MSMLGTTAAELVEEFERIAERFTRDTGFPAPGKDYVFPLDADELKRALFEMWCIVEQVRRYCLLPVGDEMGSSGELQNYALGIKRTSEDILSMLPKSCNVTAKEKGGGDT